MKSAWKIGILGAALSASVAAANTTTGFIRYEGTSCYSAGKEMKGSVNVVLPPSYQVKGKDHIDALIKEGIAHIKIRCDGTSHTGERTVAVRAILERQIVDTWRREEIARHESKYTHSGNFDYLVPADERKLQEEENRQKALSEELNRKAKAEAVKREQDQERVQAFLQAHGAMNDPADDRQPQFLRAVLLNPFAYEGNVIAVHGLLENMVSPAVGVFLVYPNTAHLWRIAAGYAEAEYAVVSGLPKGFNPPDGRALLVGEVLGKIDMVNGFGATVGLPHLQIVGLCTVSQQVEAVPAHPCRDVIGEREVVPAAVESVAVSSTPSAQPSTTLEAVPEPGPSPTPAQRETRQEVPEQPQSPTVQSSAPTRADEYVQRMIRYAMSEDAADSEAKILTAKRDIEALNLKSQAVQRQRKKAREANDRGLQHLRRWEVPEAVQAFRTAIEADPADIEVINNLGHAYLWQDDLPRAEAWLLRALTVAPGRSYAWADLGHVYAKQGEIAKGVACFANAYRFARNQDVSRRSFQGIADDEGQHAAVREAARQVLQLRLVQAHP